MPSRALNRMLWVLVLVAIVVLGVGAREQIETLFAGVGTLDVDADSTPNTVTMRWRGRIDAPMAQEIASAYEQHRSDATTFVIEFNSPGGSLDHGAEVARILRSIAATHRLVTAVESGKLCASMCVPLYLQGEVRTAALDARFMFHEVSFRDHFTSDALDVPAAATKFETDRLFLKYFVPAGVSETWIRRVRADMTGGEDVWKTARELVDEDAGIVQQVF